MRFREFRRPRTKNGLFPQLAYGYWPIETQRELSLVQIEEIVRLCGQEIKARGAHVNHYCSDWYTHQRIPQVSRSRCSLLHW